MAVWHVLYVSPLQLWLYVSRTPCRTVSPHACVAIVLPSPLQDPECSDFLARHAQQVWLAAAVQQPALLTGNQQVWAWVQQRSNELQKPLLSAFLVAVRWGAAAAGRMDWLQSLAVAWRVRCCQHAHLDTTATVCVPFLCSVIHGPHKYQPAQLILQVLAHAALCSHRGTHRLCPAITSPALRSTPCITAEQRPGPAAPCRWLLHHDPAFASSPDMVAMLHSLARAAPCEGLGSRPDSELPCYVSVCAHGSGAISAAAKAGTISKDTAQAATALAQRAATRGVLPPSHEALSQLQSLLERDPAAGVWSPGLCSSLPATKHLAQVLCVGLEGVQRMVQLQPQLLMVPEAEQQEQEEYSGPESEEEETGRGFCLPEGLRLAAGLVRRLMWLLQVRADGAAARCHAPLQCCGPASLGPCR
jgi:hypothetical protein